MNFSLFEKGNMSESGMVATFFICTMILFITFGGDPDLMDAIIQHLQTK